MRYLSALIAGALVLAGGAADTALSATTTLSAATTTTGPVAGGGTSAGCAVTLPGGDRVTWLRSAQGGPDGGPNGGQSVLSAPGSAIALVAHVGGDVYAFPPAALRSPGDPAAYDVTAAAARACGVHTAAAPRRAAPPGTRFGDLTINALDTSGAGPSGYVFLRNVDDLSLADDALVMVDGVVKVQVPAGHYAVEATTAGYSASAGIESQVAIDPDFTVTAGGTTVTLDERRATSAVTPPATPRPASLSGGTLGIGRAAADDPTTAVNWLAFDLVFPVHVTPTASVTHGGMDVIGTFELASPSTASSPYVYHVEEPFTGRVPAAWPATAAASSFATVTRDYYARGGGRQELVLDGAVPRSYNEGDPNYDVADLFDWPLRTVTAPLSDTEYFTADTNLVWQTMVTDDLNVNELITTAPRVYTAGRQTSETFDQGAEHPGPVVDTERFATICPACSSANALGFNLYPLNDNVVGDWATGNIELTGAGEYEDYGYRLLRDGVVESSSSTAFPTGVTVSGLPAGPATYQLSTSVTRNVADDPLSTSQQTVWTFRADPSAAGSRVGVPANWSCLDGTRDCTPLPLLYAYYTVSGTSLSNGLAAGPHTLTLDLTHQQFSRAPGVTGASVQVSYDAGATWRDAHTAAARGGEAGEFTAGFTIPATATGGLSLRVSGWDAAGNRVEQTVVDAYTIG